MYHPGKENANADPLSRGPKPTVVKEAVQQDGVAAITACGSAAQDIQSLLEADPSTAVGESMDLTSEQKKDTLLKEMIHYLEKGGLPKDGRRARQIAAQGPSRCSVFCGLVWWTQENGPARSSPKRCNGADSRRATWGPLLW